MGNLIERNQQRKEKRVNILMCILERLSSARAEECPHEFVEVSTQVRRRSFIFCREFGLLHLSRTKRKKELEIQQQRGSQKLRFRPSKKPIPGRNGHWIRLRSEKASGIGADVVRPVAY
ncbi:hypothetical protein VNO78_35160 [Psophocarpus tetragonolobus]|uniref:Uncharacterized protein n=1 Tax=Psophocarpus tetragonolobus TaxID=3891 RepID=A0AAN9NRV6_PSOTE